MPNARIQEADEVLTFARTELGKYYRMVTGDDLADDAAILTRITPWMPGWMNMLLKRGRPLPFMVQLRVRCCSAFMNTAAGGWASASFVRNTSGFLHGRRRICPRCSLQPRRIFPCVLIPPIAGGFCLSY